MSKKFHQELEELIKNIIEMAELAQYMLTGSCEAFKNLDDKLADDIRDKRLKLAELDENIEQKSMLIIALYQPMAVDMRTIGCVLKIISYIYRIGRYGKDIAGFARAMNERRRIHIKKLVSIPQMHDIATSLFTDTIKAFKDKALDSIKNHSERDDMLDELWHSIFRECLTYMMEDPKNIMPCTYYILVARYLERVGDNCCKMAEKIHYMITGKRIEIK
ncbi:MAG: phosphate signaling complex protein PhoU [Candidatus Helarchaeota archaeon]